MAFSKLPVIKFPALPFPKDVIDERYALLSLLGFLGTTVAVITGFAVFGSTPKSDYSNITATLNLPKIDTRQAPQKTSSQQLSASQPKRVVEDAIAGLHESLPQGFVPIIRQSDKMTAFKAYAAPFEPSVDAKALISIVLTDYGLSQKLNDQALELPSAISFALSPYASYAQNLVTKAREDSHEVWVQLPIQKTSNDDTGPLTIRVGNSLDENRSRALSVLGKATGYVGVVVTGDLAMSAKDVSFSDVFQNITARGLGVAAFVNEYESFDNLLTKDLTPHAVSSFYDLQTPTEIAAILQKTTEDALANSKAVVYLNLTPASLKQLEIFMPQWKEKKIAIAPLSAFINQK